MNCDLQLEDITLIPVAKFQIVMALQTDEFYSSLPELFNTEQRI